MLDNNVNKKRLKVYSNTFSYIIKMVKSFFVYKGCSTPEKGVAQYKWQRKEIRFFHSKAHLLAHCAAQPKHEDEAARAMRNAACHLAVARGSLSVRQYGKHRSSAFAAARVSRGNSAAGPWTRTSTST
jgi:hypothetical protein